MNINEALEFIESTAWKGSMLGLERMKALMELLGNPQDRLNFVHIAGTNGKGSTSAMIASVLFSAGYRTGMYTSPHLIKYNERMKINGCDITDEAFARTAEIVKAACDKMSFEEAPTVFEVVTAMAFVYFAMEKCDVVVLEVGLGGRFDATNVIGAPLISVICNLDLEHTEILGNTIEEIAFEKAGIIKPGRPVVLYGQTEKAEKVIKDIADERNCELTITDKRCAELITADLFSQTINYKERRNLIIGLTGSYQLNNALTAIEAADVINRISEFNISEEALRKGLAEVKWPGRFECICKNPLVIADGAHNPNGVAQLADSLRIYFPGEKFTFVCGVMADKDYDSMLELISPFANRFITVTPENKRALDSKNLSREIEDMLKIKAISCGTVKNGLAKAMEYKEKGENICIFGSLYQMGEVLEFFGRDDEL